MAHNIYSYNGAVITYDEIVFAKPLDDNRIKLLLKGSAGAGSNHKYEIQHREQVICWPRKVWEAVVADAALVVKYDAAQDKAKIS